MKKYISILILISMIFSVGVIGCSSKEVSERSLAKMIFLENPKQGELKDLSIVNKKSEWGTLGTHDPSIYKDEDTYYVFSTDARVGGIPTPGIQVRKSKDMINWEYVGTALDEIPLEAKEWSNAQGLWAPEMTKVGDEYYLYYCASSFGKNKSYIGLLKSKSIEGPWDDQGLVLKTDEGEDRNALDPNIIYDRNGEMWMSYGSFWNGIYLVKLDKETGKPIDTNDKGINIASRDGSVSGAVEGPYIIYNKEQDKYYLFVSYDSLSADYNIRVGRSDNIEGPYLDSQGNDMTDKTSFNPNDVGNKIAGGYKFGDGQGWLAPGHNSVLNDDGNYYIVHHARLEESPDWFYMHVRKIVWSKDGWPIVSPERYAGELEQKIEKQSIPGEWEIIVQDKNINTIIPSSQYTFKNSGKIKNEEKLGTWKLTEENIITLTLPNNDGEEIEYQGKILPAWDWENNKATLVFTAIDKLGVSIWGKLINS